jgi:diguanylate cyclase (GGDEF)-like protein
VFSKVNDRLRFIGKHLKRHRANRPLASRIPIGPAVVSASVLTTIFLTMIKFLGAFESLELSLFDWMVRSRPFRPETDERLLIVGITEADIQSRKQWPFPDGLIAEILDILLEYDPAVVGLDLYRDVPLQPGHDRLVEQLNSPKVIGITKLGDRHSEGVPAPPSLPPERVGFNDLILDNDGIVRRNLLYANREPSGEAIFSFGVQLALKYLQKFDIQPRNSQDNPYQIYLGKATFDPLEVNSGGYQTIDPKGYQILLDYRAPETVARQVSMTQVLAGNIEPEWVKDKIVLIGTVAPSLKDMFFTPYSADGSNVQMAGVVIHAQILSQLLDSSLEGKGLFWFWPEWVEIVWLALWSGVGGVLVWRSDRPLKLFGLATGAIAAIVASGFGVFLFMGWIPIASAIAALLLSGSGAIASKVLYTLFYDPLTGLPNRAGFVQEMGRLKRRLLKGERTAKPAASPSTHSTLSTGSTAFIGVVFLDVDRFKTINDGLGHEVGDRLLVAFAKRLQQILGEQRRKSMTDTGLRRTQAMANAKVARVGSDEFAILLENIHQVEEAAGIAEQVRRQLTIPFDIEGHEIYSSASIGMALGPASEDRDLLREAHTAMYRAKVLGKPNLEVFETTMQSNAIARLELETDLRRSLRDNEHLRQKIHDLQLRGEDYSALNSQFPVYYQPIVDLPSGRIAGFEALVRWEHPQRGRVFPGEFIPLAEETGEIIPLGAWVLEEACRQIRQWQQQIPGCEHLTIAINLSGKQFNQLDLLDTIATTLELTQLDPHCVKLEITESVVMDEVEAAIAMLNKMKALNVKLGIDDFGTGYSSLSYLHQFPTDTLKVDRSFVSRMEQGEDKRAIVKTIIDLAHNLNMEVVAEGIETPEELARLRSLACEYGQGYFFAKPLPKHEATALLHSNPKW